MLSPKDNEDFSLSLFEFIRQRRNGQCSLEDLKENFIGYNIEETLDSHPSLFWARKFSFDKWDIRVKLDLELCYLYSNNKQCAGGCSKLHMCKRFLLGNQFCSETKCKFELCHDPLDTHNKGIIEQYNIPSNDIALVRSSFPRLCQSFVRNGKCSILYCGNIHLCPDFILNKCQLKCRFSSRVGVKKQESHHLASTHNQSVFQSFQLLPNGKEILLANILHNLTEPVNSNEDFVTNDSESIASIDEESVNTNPLILCTFYQSGSCKNGNMCDRLHFCKEYLINSANCSAESCSGRFSHDIFDENNARIISPKYQGNKQEEVLRKLRKLFPQICYYYNREKCSRITCRYLHICQEFAKNNCNLGNCKLSHNLKDEHNARVYESFNLKVLLEQKDTRYLKTNILVSNRCGNQISERSNNKTTTNTKNEVTRSYIPLLCNFYLNGKCLKNQNCPRLHFCKEYLFNSGKCATENNCRYGFSHDLLDESNKSIITRHFTEYDNHLSILEDLRTSYSDKSDEKNAAIKDDRFCIPKENIEKKTKIIYRKSNDPEKEDIFSYILDKNPHEGYCSLDDKQLLSFFDDQCEDLALNWFKKNSASFRLVTNALKETVVFVSFVNVEPCRFYWQKAGCRKKQCGRFHVCKKMLYQNHNANSCNYNHDFEKQEVACLIKKNKLQRFSDEQVITLLRNRYPFVCSQYQHGTCQETEEYCSKLHICKEFVCNNCKSSEEICGLRHQSALDGEQAMRLAKSFHMDKNDFRPCLMFERTANEQPGNLENESLNVYRKSNDKDIETIIGHILDLNPHEGSCLLDDVQLLSFFNDQSIELAQNWFKKNSSYFRLATNSLGKPVVYACLVNVEPCRFYWGKKGCVKKQCGRFHICKQMLYQNHNAISCSSNHDFQTPQISELIKRNKLQKFSDDQIVSLLRNRYPFICSNYQSGSCQSSEEHCIKLHICKEFIQNKCKKSEELCGLRHQTALDGDQAIRLAKWFHLRQIDFRSCLMFEKNAFESLTKNTGVAGFNSSKDEGICLLNINGGCPNKKLCTLHHVNWPYIWQYKESSGEVWKNIPDALNEDTEKEFSIPSKCTVDVVNGTGLVSTLGFDSLSAEGIFTDTVGGHTYRRLSTKSSVLVNKDGILGATEWKWFWEKENNELEEYSSSLCSTTSEEIEKSYVNGAACHTFTTAKFSYTLTFDTMIQQNQDQQYLTERNVKRRPLFQTKFELGRNKSILCLLPSTWPKSFKPGDLIDVSASKLSELSTKFTQSMTKTVQVIKIQEVCNEEFYERYESKKKAMSKLNQAGERLLYHGTANDTVQHICVQNFDFRVCGKNATAYGKGSYFSENAAYSHNYCSRDSNGYYYMFVAQVLTGRFTRGSSSYSRPPPIQADSLELYDSCVDNVSNPTMYIIFERDQCYPRYMITYRRFRKN